MIQFACDSCGKSSDAWIVGRAAEAVALRLPDGRSRSNQPGIGRLRCILLLFTSAPSSARTATWRNYSRLTLLRKKELLSEQIRQKSWLKEAAPNCTGSRRRVRSSKSIVRSGRLDTILLHDMSSFREIRSDLRP